MQQLKNRHGRHFLPALESLGITRGDLTKEAIYRLKFAGHFPTLMQAKEVIYKALNQKKRSYPEASEIFNEAEQRKKEFAFWLEQKFPTCKKEDFLAVIQTFDGTSKSGNSAVNNKSCFDILYEISDKAGVNFFELLTYFCESNQRYASLSNQKKYSTEELKKILKTHKGLTKLMTLANLNFSSLERLQILGDFAGYKIIHINPVDKNPANESFSERNIRLRTKKNAFQGYWDFIADSAGSVESQDILCTFTDDERQQKNDIFWVIRKDLVPLELETLIEKADSAQDYIPLYNRIRQKFAEARVKSKIQRPDLKNKPQRQNYSDDESWEKAQQDWDKKVLDYTKAVMTFQVARYDRAPNINAGDCILPNYLNHNLNEFLCAPIDDIDRPFDGDPDNLMPGLRFLFEQVIGRKTNIDTSVKDYVWAKDDNGKEIPVLWHTELEGYYYAEKCYVDPRGKLHALKDTQICVDGCVIDIDPQDENGFVKPIPSESPAVHRFWKKLTDVLNYELSEASFKGNLKIKPLNDGNFGVGVMEQGEFKNIIAFKNGHITELFLPLTEKIEEYTLVGLEHLKKFTALRVQILEEGNLSRHEEMEKIELVNLPECKEIGRYCVNGVKDLQAPMLQRVKECSCCHVDNYSGPFFVNYMEDFSFLKCKNAPKSVFEQFNPFFKKVASQGEHQKCMRVK